MEINRVWAMPSSKTFSIKSIRELVEKYIHGFSIDPFANDCNLADVTNDLDPDVDTDCHLEAIEFLKLFDDDSVDTVLYDPPYSVRQVSEVYKKFGLTVNKETTRSDYWTKLNSEVARVTKRGGIVITCGWNSGGVGKKNGFEMLELLLVPHGDIITIQ